MNAAPHPRRSSRRGAAALLAAALTLLPVAAFAGPPISAGKRRSGPEPFFRARSATSTYPGPGREQPEPQGLTEVKLAWFGPSQPSDPEGGPPWSAASLALEEANAQGGYRGLPFRLVVCWSENPWGTGVSRLFRLIYEEQVWAVIGSRDGESTHLAEQVVVQARVALLSPASTDKTVNLAGVPWAFSLAPADDLQAPALAQALLRSAGGGPFVVLSSTAHDARMTSAELLSQLSRRGATPALRLTFAPGVRGDADLVVQLERIEKVAPAALVVVAGAADGARVVRAVRGRGISAPLFGGATMGSRAFLREAGRAAEGVVFPRLFDPASSPRARDFVRRFQARFGYPPDYRAAHTYDAVGLLVAAVRQAGLNRARIRDALRALPPWQGVTGTVRWDPTGQNLHPVTLGTVRRGRLVPYRSGPPETAEAAGGPR